MNMRKLLFIIIYILTWTCSQAQIKKVGCVPLSVNSYTIYNINCNDNCIGSAYATSSNGTPPFTYLWAPSGGTKDTALNLCKGNYTVTVTDKNGCSGTSSCFIADDTISLSKTIINASCPSCCDGSITTTVFGGSPPYTYQWTPPVGTGCCAYNLCSGKYQVCVIDGNWCEVCDSTTITSVPLTIQNIKPIDRNCSIFPNPNSGKFTISLQVVSLKTQITIYNILGEQIYQAPLNATTTQINISNKAEGLYLYRVLSETGELLGEGKFVIE